MNSFSINKPLDCHRWKIWEQGKFAYIKIYENFSASISEEENWVVVFKRAYTSLEDNLQQVVLKTARTHEHLFGSTKFLIV